MRYNDSKRVKPGGVEEMATIREVKKELRHREWAEEIAECQSSGMKIRNWCQMKGISCNTYYRRLQIVRTELLAQTEQSMQQIIPLSSAMASVLPALMAGG